MSEINATFRFSWEPATWGQSFKALFRNPSPGPTWVQDLKAFDMAAFTRVREKGSPRSPSDELSDKSPEESCNILLKTVVYLAKYPHPRLERILQEKLESVSNAQSMKNVFHSILLLSLRTNRPQMLDVCQKVLSSQKLAELFYRKDVMELAKKDARVVPKPEYKVVTLTKALLQSLQQPLLKIRRIIRYVFSTTSQAYAVDFNTPPLTAQRAQNQWTFYRDTLHDICILVPFVKALFTTQWKTSIFVATILGVSIAAAYQTSESPSNIAGHFSRPELTPRLLEADYVQQCHNPPYPNIKREPSSELETCLQALEQLLLNLNRRKKLNIDLSNSERDSDPYWTESDKGKQLDREFNKINHDIETQQNNLLEIKKLSLRLAKLSQIHFEYRQKECAAIHLLKDQAKCKSPATEETQKLYLLFKFLFLPEILREYESIPII